jgi:hypothetical protein
MTGQQRVVYPSAAELLRMPWPARERLRRRLCVRPAEDAAESPDSVECGSDVVFRLFDDGTRPQAVVLPLMDALERLYVSRAAAARACGVGISSWNCIRRGATKRVIPRTIDRLLAALAEHGVRVDVDDPVSLAALESVGRLGRLGRLGRRGRPVVRGRAA